MLKEMTHHLQIRFWKAQWLTL